MAKLSNETRDELIVCMAAIIRQQYTNLSGYPKEIAYSNAVRLGDLITNARLEMAD